MIADIIKLALSNYPITFFLIGLLGAGSSLRKRRRIITKALAFEAFLSFYCLFSVGFFYVYNFVMHVFFGKMAASFIGWEDSPFQLEVGFASLGFGVVGFLAFRGDFGLRLAAITGPAFFMWGAAGGHVYQMIANHNFEPGNAGVMFWADIFLPAIGFFLLIGCPSSRMQRRPSGTRVAAGEARRHVGHHRSQTADQLTDNLAAVALKLAPEEIQRLDEVSVLPPEYPGWMIPVQGADRTDPSKARFGRK